MIEAPRPDYLDDARKCRTEAEVQGVWHRARAAGHGSDELLADLQAIAADIARGVDPSTGEIGDQDDDGATDGDEVGPDDDGIVDAEVVREDDEPPVANPSAVSWPSPATPGSGVRK